MKLTKHFSRINADLPPPGRDSEDDMFLHGEGMNLPSQGRRNLPFREEGEESPLEDRSYSQEEIYELFHKYNMPDPVVYDGDEYDFTGKMGLGFEEPRTLTFEYSNRGTIDNEPVERRLWMDIHGNITED